MGESEPPLVTVTAIPSGTASSLPSVAQAVHNSKLATAAAATAAANATASANNTYSGSCPFTQQGADNGSDYAPAKRVPTTISSCPHCGASNVTTRIRTYPTGETWGLCILTFIVFSPLCWLPLVMDSCKATDHFCTRCNGKVDSVRPLSDCCVTEMG